MVSDADFAFKAALRRPPLTRSAHLNRIRLRAGQATAVCGAALNGCGFAGFADGAWTRFDPETGDPSFWRAEKDNNGAVTALATDPGGNLLVVLSTFTRDNQVLASYLCELGTYRLRSRPLPLVHGPAWLTPIAVSDGHAVVGLWHGGRLATLRARDLVPTGEIAVPSPAEEVLDATVALVPPGELGAAVLLAPRASGRPRGWLLFVGEHLWHFAGEGRLQATPVNMGWRPGAFWGDLNSAPPLSWRLAGEGLELTGISLDGSVHWSEVQFQDEASTDAIVHAAVPQSGYAAANLVGPGRVAAVRRAGIDWLRLERRRLLPWTATGIDLAGAVACCHSPPTNQLLVVGRDGWLVRVPVPH